MKLNEVNKTSVDFWIISCFNVRKVNHNLVTNKWNGYWRINADRMDGIEIVESKTEKKTDSILYVGFKGKNNSSCKLVSSLKGEQLFLTNSFEGVHRDIDALTREYKKVIMFGLDKKLSDCIRFESIAKKNGQPIYTSFDMTPYIRLAIKENISYCVSDNPTEYLCNEAYFYMLNKMSCPVLLVHIPGLTHMSESFWKKLITIF